MFPGREAEGTWGRLGTGLTRLRMASQSLSQHADAGQSPPVLARRPPAPAGRGPEWSELTMTGLEGMELHGVGVGCASEGAMLHPYSIHSFSTCVSSPCQKYHPS